MNNDIRVSVCVKAQPRERTDTWLKLSAIAVYTFEPFYCEYRAQITNIS